MNDYVLYILMRKDLPSMNVGRAAAQASHASNAFIHSYGSSKSVKSWQRQTNQGFGTAIVLSTTADDVASIFIKLSQMTNKIPHAWVEDPEYGMPVSQEIFGLLDRRVWESNTAKPIVKEDGTVIFFRSIVTCAYVFGKKSELTEILGKYPLWPN